MITVKSLGQWFHNNSILGKLVSIYTVGNSPRIRIEVKGGHMNMTLAQFEAEFINGIPKGTIAEATDHTGQTSLWYSDGKGNLCLSKEMSVGLPLSLFKEIKIISC